MFYETVSCENNKKRARLIGTIFSSLAAGYSQMGCDVPKWLRPSNAHFVNCDWILIDFEERQVRKLFKTLFYIMLHIFESISITLGLLGLVILGNHGHFHYPNWNLTVVSSVNDSHFGVWIHKYSTSSSNLKTNTAAGFCFCIGEPVEIRETLPRRQEDHQLCTSSRV